MTPSHKRMAVQARKEYKLKTVAGKTGECDLESITGLWTAYGVPGVVVALLY